MKKIILITILSFFLLMSSVNAQVYISNCGWLNAGTTYYLTQDVNFTSGYCMLISANNAVLDCQGHTINGLSGLSWDGILIYGWWGTSITVKNCVIQGCSASGIYSQGWFAPILNYSKSTYNLFINNTFTHNGGSFLLYQSSSNVFTNNTIKDNRGGIIFFQSGGNEIFNNLFFNNTNDTCVSDFSQGAFACHSEPSPNNYFPNYYNTTRQEGSRIYSSGINIGGNYWGNVSGTGYSDTCRDSSHDGFCDESYILTDGIDYLPYSNKYFIPSVCVVSQCPALQSGNYLLFIMIILCRAGNFLFCYPYVLAILIIIYAYYRIYKKWKGG
jgi:parallel beta-helix repeat protein